MNKTVLRVLTIILAAAVSGIGGLMVGAFIGGNLAEQFVFNGVRGYEATGQVGFILGALIGLGFSSWFLLRRKP
jgi:hypothetical protein